MKTVDSSSLLSSASLPTRRLVGTEQSSLPQLLISARSAVECLEAVHGGAEILDLKEPASGALGRVTAEQLAACLAVLEPHSDGISVSLAMGELLEWGPGLSPDQSAFVEIIRAHKHRIRFLKFGLSGCDESAFRAEWTVRLSALRRLVSASSLTDGTQSGAVNQTRIHSEPHFIPACYADWKQAASPPPIAVVSALPNLCSPGMLIDTFVKNGTGVFGYLSSGELEVISQSCRAASMFLALAGQIGVSDLSRVAGVCPDIVGVRGVVCREGRESALDGKLVATFRSRLHEAFELAGNSR